jgi:hypothetical protein
MLTNLFLAKEKASTAIGLQWFDEDFYLLLIRLCVNVVFITILIRFLYYAKTKRKDYLFTYYLIGTITFFSMFWIKETRYRYRYGTWAICHIWHYTLQNRCN